MSTFKKMNLAHTKETSIILEIPFTSFENAQLVYDVLSVDKEVKGSGVHRDFHLNSKLIVIKFQSLDLKRLRVAVNAIFKNILLITTTIENFATKQA